MSEDGVEPIIWMRPEVTGRGKPPAYSRKQLAQAAIKIADTDGIEAVSMRRVAAAIGAAPMSLYRYVRNKDELYMLMVDEVLDTGGGQERFANLDWKSALWELAHGIRQLVLAHPWFPEISAGIPVPGPTLARAMEIAMGFMDGLGLDIDQMLEIVILVQTFATGFAKNEFIESNTYRSSGLDREQWMRRQAPYIRHLIDSGEFPYLSRIVIDARTPHEGDDALFERALGRIIAGIEATLPRKAE